MLKKKISKFDRDFDEYNDCESQMFSDSDHDDILKKAPLPIIQKLSIFAGCSLLFLHFAIILYNLYYMLFVITSIKNVEVAEKQINDIYHILVLNLFCLLIQLPFIYGLYNGKKWVVFSSFLFASVLSVYSLLTSMIWLQRNMYEPMNIDFCLSFAALFWLCSLLISSAITSFQFYLKLRLQNLPQQHLLSTVVIIPSSPYTENFKKSLIIY